MTRFVLLLLLLTSCVYRDNSKREAIAYGDRLYYYNEKCVIVQKGYGYHGYYFLLKRINSPIKYTELNGFNWSQLGGFGDRTFYSNGNPLFHSKEIGDTLFFEYLSKDRFWEKVK